MKLHLISKKNKLQLYSLFIFVSACLLYVNTISNSYSLDDVYVTGNNPKVQKGIAGVPEIFTSRYVDEEGNSFGYRPVAAATFAIEYTLWGENPHVSHLINLLLYALNLMLLFRVLLKIFPETTPLLLFFAVLLFSAHPIHTEVVASLKNRETLLSFLFCVISLGLFIKWSDSRKWVTALTGLFIFILAFLSKQDAITFAAIIPMALFFRSGDPLPAWMTFPIKITLNSIIAFFAIVLFVLFWIFSGRPQFWITAAAGTLSLLFLTVYFYKSRNDTGSRTGILSWFFLAAGVTFSVLWLFTMHRNYAIVAMACFLVFFLRIMEKPPVTTIFRKGHSLRILIMMAVIVLAGIAAYKLPGLFLPPEQKVVYNFENPQFVNDPGYPALPLAFYTLWFYLTKLLFPHPLGFYYGYKMIPEVGWTTPEVILSLLFHTGILIFALWKLPKKHILSFAILGYLVTISIFTNIIIKIPGIVGERLAFFPSLGFCMALAWAFFRLTGTSVVEKTVGKNCKGWLTAAFMLLLVPYTIKTIDRNKNWKDHLTLYSHDITYLANSAKANNLYAGELLKMATGEGINKPTAADRKEYLDQAAGYFKKTIEIDSTFKFAWNNLGAVYFNYLGNTGEAIRYIERAVRLDPRYGEAHYNLGYMYREVKDFPKSIYHFREAQQIFPGRAFYFTGEAETWFQAGNRDSSLLLFKKAADMDPAAEMPLARIGDIYWLMGDTLKAVGYWEKSFEINPTNLIICNNLLIYYAGKRDPKAAWYSSQSEKLQKKDK